MSRFVSRLSLAQLDALRAFWVQIDHDFGRQGFQIDRSIYDSLLAGIQGQFHPDADTFRMAELLSKCQF